MSCDAGEDSGPESDDEPYTPIKPEDFARYLKQVEESHGFDVDSLPGPPIARRIAPIYCHSECFVVKLSHAIDEHNQLRKAEGRPSITLARPTKLNARLYPPTLYYTFEANDPGGTTMTYQAQLDLDGDKVHAVIFRLKPSSVV